MAVTLKNPSSHVPIQKSPVSFKRDQPSMQQQTEVKLKSAESAILFIQNEHQNVLSGLHEEIHRLQQKCSDLQFTVTSHTSSAKAEADLRSLVAKLQEETGKQRIRILQVEQELDAKTKRVEELEEHMRWREVEFNNQVTSYEAKIQTLKTNANLQREVDRLQTEVKRLYAENPNQQRMGEISRRARSPDKSRLEPPAEEDDRSETARSEAGSEASFESLSSIYSSGRFEDRQLMSMPPLMTSSDEGPMIKVPLKALTSNSARSKVFRHKLARTLSEVAPPPTGIDMKPALRSNLVFSDFDIDSIRKVQVHLHSNPPRSMGASVPAVDTRLPHDYKSPVATLPPIGPMDLSTLPVDHFSPRQAKAEEKESYA